MMAKALEDEYLTSTRIALNLHPAALDSRFNLRHWDIGPLLQGVIMECVAPEYVELLHSMSFNPYSQHCIIENDAVTWVINSLTNEAYSVIVEPVMGASKLCIKKLGLPLAFGEQIQSRLSRRELIDIVHGSKKRRFILRFVSPTSFKSAGNYQIIPSLHLIYQNLIMHYSQVFEADHEADPETVDYLVAHTRIVKYDLSSRAFLLSGKKLPAFIGTMTIEVNGAQPLVGFAHMLLRFGTFSGVGIKTSMGMGGLWVE